MIDPLSAFANAMTLARVEELTRQRDALQREIAAIEAHDPATLARFHLYTGEQITRHGLDCAARERARFTPAEQAAANARALAASQAEFDAYKARR
jgi:hypothetical protein